MATHSSILAYGIPWTEKPSRPWSIGSQRVRHNKSDLACLHIYKYFLKRWKKGSNFTERNVYGSNMGEWMKSALEIFESSDS